MFPSRSRPGVRAGHASVPPRGGRRLAAAAAVLVGSLLLTACGSASSDAGSSATSSAPSSAAPSGAPSSAAGSSSTASGSAGSSAGSSAAASSGAATSSASAFPVEIATAFGTTVVDAAPERVVVVGYSEGDTVLALGTVPVAVQEFSYPGRPGGPWIDSLLQGRTPTVLTGTQLNYEQIASLTPDLIIGISRALTDQDYAALSAIAPTLARPAEYPDFGVPVDVQARMVGQALGKSAEVDALLSDVQDQIDAARTDHPEFQGTTYSAVWPRAGGQGWFAWTPIDVRSQFMTALGLQLSDSITALGQENFYVEISAENTAQIDADVIVVIDVEAQRSTLEADPVFTALPAVQAGHVAWVTGTDLIAAFNYGSVLSLPFALQGIVPILQEAVAA